MYQVKWPAILVIAVMSSLNLSAEGGRGSPFLVKDSVYNTGGLFSLGVRGTANIFFTDTRKSFGTGFGASARMQLVDRVNTEWFSDYVTSNLYNKANRTDAHIGWNVMCYILNPKGFKRKFTPFIAAGQCFDYTGIRLNGENQKLYQRWTAAVQMSVGCHYNITPRFDISLSTLYDLHLGNEVDADLNSNGNIVISQHSNAGWEGHMMLIFSAHYKLIQLWKPKGQKSRTLFPAG